MADTASTGPKKKPASRKRRKIASRTKGKASAAKKKKVSPRDVKKRVQKLIQSVTRESTAKKAAQLTLTVVDFQKTTIGNSIDVIGKLQDQTGKLLHKLMKDASWVPSEGREVVDEWIRTVKKGRADFKKSSDKSFDLISKYIKRLEKQQGSKAAARKKGAKKKPVTKSTAKKAATPRKSASKRTKRVRT